VRRAHRSPGLGHRERVLDLIEALRDELGVARASATHDADVAARARRTIELADGRVVEETGA
jgi:predicted ABC-type transport system involved in lysophospholipase L1 biosynthesis ATPase subunit